ncbi:MAG: hypothetical protein PHW76_07015 [Alphaproteobacteria bacterium]|nr:hypothetical protein [Alphaproteobacteria bacterium]
MDKKSLTRIWMANRASKSRFANLPEALHDAVIDQMSPEDLSIDLGLDGLSPKEAAAATLGKIFRGLAEQCTGGPIFRTEEEVLESLQRHDHRISCWRRVLDSEEIGLLYRDTVFLPGDDKIFERLFENISYAIKARMELSSEIIEEANRLDCARDLEKRRQEELKRKTKYEASPEGRAEKVGSLLEACLKENGLNYFVHTDAKVMMVKSHVKLPSHDAAEAYVKRIADSSEAKGLKVFQNEYGVRVEGPIGELLEVLEKRVTEQPLRKFETSKLNSSSNSNHL